MSRKFNTKHPDRSLSGYHFLKKTRGDRYGQFDNGQQLSPDYIRGKKIFYRDKSQEKEVIKRTGYKPRVQSESAIRKAIRKAA